MKYLVTVLAVLAMASVAGATQQVWFQVVPVQNATVTTQGVAGGSTVIKSNGLLGQLPMIADVNVWLLDNGDQGGIIWWDTCLKTAETDTTGGTPRAQYLPSYQWWDPDQEIFVTRTYSNDGHGTGPGGPLPAMLYKNSAHDANYPAASVFDIYGAVAFQVGKFRLTDVHEGTLEDDFIYAGTNVAGWAFRDLGTLPEPRPSFGNNLPVVGTLGTWAPLPVITIHEIPEPGTLMLLGLGLVGLLRRR